VAVAGKHNVAVVKFHGSILEAQAEVSVLLDLIERLVCEQLIADHRTRVGVPKDHPHAAILFVDLGPEAAVFVPVHIVRVFHHFLLGGLRRLLYLAVVLHLDVLTQDGLFGAGDDPVRVAAVEVVALTRLVFVPIQLSDPIIKIFWDLYVSALLTLLADFVVVLEQPSLTAANEATSDAVVWVTRLKTRNVFQSQDHLEFIAVNNFFGNPIPNITASCDVVSANLGNNRDLVGV
jgi:hypothetical protein